MPYCSRCGVEVDGHVSHCPLCNTSIQRFEDTEPGERRYPTEELGVKPKMSDRMRRRILWEVLTLFCAIGVLVVIGSDLRVDGSISWSLYPTASIVLAWLYATLFVFFRKRPAVAAVGVVGSTIAFLAAVDLANGRLDWFFLLGLPILAFFLIIAAVIVLAILKAKDRGFNIVAFVLLGVALFCAGVDLLVSLYLRGRAGLSWSEVVLLTLVPLSLIFLFLHYRLRNRFDFKRIFHF